MSSRGQVVIPKALREAAGLHEGDELEVVFDGESLLLAPCRANGVTEREGVGITGSGIAREENLDYAPAGRVHDRERLSKVWAERVRALADIERLSAEFKGVSFDELWSEARQELRGEAGGE